MIGQKTMPLFPRSCRGVRPSLPCLSPDPVVRFLARLAAFTFLFLLPLLCHDLKHSAYFAGMNSDFRKEAMQAENDERVTLAKKYFSMLDQTKLENMLRKFNGESHNHSQDIIISIITVSRNRNARRLDGYEPYYLTQVVWKFLELLHTAQSAGFPYHVRLMLCDVDQDPENYEEAAEMAKYVPRISRNSKLTLHIGHPLEKEKQDYVFCLNSSLALNPGYVFLVEDDALPHPDLFPVLQHTLETHLESKVKPQGRDASQGQSKVTSKHKTVAYVKFYHPERLLGFFQPEWERLPELLGWGVTLGSLLTFAFMRLHPGACANNYNPYRIWGFFILYVMLAAAMIGRVYVNEVRRVARPYLYSYTPAPSCCTPALLYPREGGSRVAGYLTGISCRNQYGKDAAIEDFLRYHADIRAYQVQPNTFSHIGMYSSLRAQIVDPYLV